MAHVFQALAVFTIGLAVVALADVAWAQEPLGVERLSAERVEAQRAHLWRVAAWGGANFAGGLTLALASDSGSVGRGFGIQTAAWGAINVGIATVGLLSGADAETTWQAAFGAERSYAGILLVNLGLNVAYSAVGTTMVLASYQDVRRANAWRGHGSALIVQGLGLFVLDGIAYLGSRARFDALTDLAGQASLHVQPEAVTLVLRF